MSDFRNNAMECPLLTTTEDILNCYRAGSVGVIKGDLIFNPEILCWSTKYLRDKHGTEYISIHNNFNLKTQTFDYSRVFLKTLIDNVSRIRQAEILSMNSVQRRELYGVTNAKRLANMEFIKHDFRDNFRHTFSFLWVGLSPGGLHCDYFDNILLQTSGEKLIRVFPATVSDEISDNHYIAMPDSLNLFSESNREKYPWLDKLPYVEVTLKAGDAVIIPSAAYHAPMAATNDSISVNTFFTPKFNNYLSSPFARKEDRYPWWVTNWSIGFSKVVFNLLGRVVLHTGHYEVI